MSLVHCEHFEDWDLSTATVEGYTQSIGGSNSIDFPVGRRVGSKSLRHVGAGTTAANCRVIRPLTPFDASSVGVTITLALYVEAYPAGHYDTVLCVADSALSSGTAMAAHLALYITSAGFLGVGSGTSNNGGADNGTNFTYLIAGSTAIGVGGWHTVEIFASGIGSGKALTLRVDGAVYASSASISTKNSHASANAYIGYLQLGSLSQSVANTKGTFRIGDLVLHSNDAIQPSGLLGSMQVYPKVPTGAGDSTQFTPSVGANWQCVDDQVNNGNTDYVETSAAGNRDLYATSALSVTPASILGVQLKATAIKDDTGARTLQVCTKSGATVSNHGSALALSNTAYSSVFAALSTDPNGGGAWTKAAVDALQIGIVAG